MPFTSQNYGTFTGPQSTLGDFIYDTTALEGSWPSEIPVDTSFKLTDIAAIFFQNEFNYSGMHLYGVVPDFVVMERNTGFIPTFMANIANTIHNGNVIVNGSTVMNGSCVINGLTNVNGVIIHNGNSVINGQVTLTGLGDVATYATTTRAIANSKKSFDIPHPTKEGWRLSHVCVEGPSADVYLRGKLRNNNVIKLPEYWKGLIDPETITVNLTPIGEYQELFVHSINNTEEIVIQNNSNSTVNCDYYIMAERIDTEKNIPEYEGTWNDYPGDNSTRSIVGKDYDRR